MQLWIALYTLIFNIPTVDMTSNNPDEDNKAEDALDKLGYYFDQNGVLKDKYTLGGFVFDTNDGDQEKNQKHYEQLGHAIEKYIYMLLVKEGGLKRIQIPISHKKGDGKGFIFVSDDWMICKKLMLIIHGSGVVKAGQWSRRLIINHSLESGSQLPYIKKAKELGYGIIVTNANQNYDEDTTKVIKGSEDPQQHFNYVWKTFVRSKCVAQYVAIVAHSYGGAITIKGAMKYEDLIDRVFAVALTDSVHGYSRSTPSKQFLRWLKKNVCNWVSSSQPLDTELRSYKDDCKRVSAGTPIHEETSWKAFESVWAYIEQHYKLRVNREENKETHKSNKSPPTSDPPLSAIDFTDDTEEKKTKNDATVDTENSEIDSTVRTENSEIDSTVDTENSEIDSTVRTENSEKDATVDTENSEKGATVRTENSEKDATVDTENSEKDATVRTENSEKDATVHTENSEKDATVDTEDVEMESQQLSDEL